MIAASHEPSTPAVPPVKWRKAPIDPAYPDAKPGRTTRIGGVNLTLEHTPGHAHALFVPHKDDRLMLLGTEAEVFGMVLRIAQKVAAGAPTGDAAKEVEDEDDRAEDMVNVFEALSGANWKRGNPFACYLDNVRTLARLLHAAGFVIRDGAVEERWRERAEGRWVELASVHPHTTQGNGHWLRIENGILLEIWADELDGSGPFSVRVGEEIVGEVEDAEDAKALAVRRAHAAGPVTTREPALAS